MPQVLRTDSICGRSVPAYTARTPCRSVPARGSARTEICELIGVGGMGEVYRARDTKLQRDVAIKVLPASVASAPERLARFEREAQLLAALNHPHIAAIYGVEESRGGPALVLELVRDRRSPTVSPRAGAAGRGAADRRQIAERARSGARAGDHPSRSEAREHQVASGRRRSRSSISDWRRRSSRAVVPTPRR